LIKSETAIFPNKAIKSKYERPRRSFAQNNAASAYKGTKNVTTKERNTNTIATPLSPINIISSSVFLAAEHMIDEVILITIGRPIHQYL
jgi:hypothetical protein